MAATPNETSLDMNKLCALITAINETNPGISSLTWSSTPTDGLPIYIKMQMPMPPSANSPQNLGKTFLGLTFQAILAAAFGFPTSSPSLRSVLFTAAELISFAALFAGVSLQNTFPRIALWLKKFGKLFAAIGICIIPNLLVHPNLAWISWLACGSCLLAFIISFKWF